MNKEAEHKSGRDLRLGATQPVKITTITALERGLNC